MVHTQHLYARCGNEYIRYNGAQGGQPKYQCKACKDRARFVPAAVAKAAQYAQVEALLTEHNSWCSICVRHGRGADDHCQTDKKSGADLAPATAWPDEKVPVSPTRSVGTR